MRRFPHPASGTAPTRREAAAAIVPRTLPPHPTPPPMAADTPPSLADENKPRHPGRWQGFVIGLVGAAALAAGVAGVTIFFGGAGEDGDGDGEGPRQRTTPGGWTGPPADSAQAELIPQALGKWDLTAADGTPGNAMLGVDLPGSHGVYAQLGVPDTVDLAVYPAGPDAADDAFAAVADRADDPARFRDVKTSEPAVPGARRSVRYDVPESEGVPELHVLLAAADGWLIVARSDTEDRLVPFVAEWMRTVESDGAAEAPTDAPAQGSRGLPDGPQGDGVTSE